MTGFGNNPTNPDMYVCLDGTTTTPSPSPSTPTATPSSSSPAPGACRVVATVNVWNAGLTENFTITDTGASAIDGWSLGFALPAGQTVIAGWNATYAPASGQVTAKNMAYNATIPANGSVSIGFQADHTGDSGKPTAFTLNGSACSSS